MNNTTTNDAPFVVCKAAAGSGKTFSLVLEYIKMAMTGPREGLEHRFRGILAITFTNKAANEMKSRIMTELERMATHGVDPDAKGTFGAALLSALQSSDYFTRNPITAVDLQDMADRLQSAILHHYTDLSVFTIDSFMHRIVRTFAHDLGQPVSFEVMTDRQMLVDEAVAQLMALVGTEGNEDLTRLLSAYADSNMDVDRGYNIEASIADLANRLFDEDIELRLKSLASLSLADFQTIHRRYSDANRAAEARLRAIGNAVLAIVEPTGMTEADCYQSTKGFLRYFRQLASGEMKRPNSYVETSMSGGKLTSSSCDKALAQRLEGLRPKLEEQYAKVLHFFEHDIVDYNTRVMLLANLYSTALLGHLYKILGEYSRNNEVLHLAEFNRMINSIVEDEDNPAPFIFERLGNRYRHFLIDEFQDTSVMQWHNIVPLVENGVSQGQESFVVGDAKQAIYRFRQGDVRQFVALPKVEGMHHHGTTLSLPGNSTLRLLDTNFRTATAVVDFNNEFFSWLVRHRYADNSLAQDIFIGRDAADGTLRAEGDEELRQRKAKSIEGHVSVALLDTDDRHEIFAEVRDTVNTLVGEGGYSYGDIMILARSNQHLAELGAWLTAESDIPQTSSQSFLLRSSDAAMAVVAALRYLHNQRDRVAVADLVQRLSNLGILGADAPQVVASPDALPEHLARYGAGIDFDPEALSGLSLYDLCEALVRQLRLDGVDLPYIATLLDAAASFAARHRQQTGDFLQWLDDHPDLSASTSDQIDAVRLLTIHKAKGLEAPVVICMLLPQTEKWPRMWVDVPADPSGEEPQLPTAFVRFSKDTPNRFSDQCDSEMLMNRVDDLNVLYVAFTRPREQLFVVAQQGNSGYPAMLAEYLSDRLDGQGRCHFGDTTWRKPASPAVGGGGGRKRVVTLERLSFAEWSSRVTVASPAEKSIVPLLEDKVRFGIYAHELMSTIHHAADVDDAVAAFVGRYHLSDEESSSLARLARMTVEHPDAQRFFAPDCRVANEMTLLDNGHIARPDRVVFGPGATWVVDFKTGVPVPQNVEQVRAYCRSLGAMGYPNVSGWLIYMHPDSVDVVPVG